jgi:hypothetical protein
MRAYKPFSWADLQPQSFPILTSQVPWITSVSHQHLASNQLLIISLPDNLSLTPQNVTWAIATGAL